MSSLSEEVKKVKQAANIPPPAVCNRFVEGFSSVYVFETRPSSHGGAFAFRYDVEMVQLTRNKSLTSGGGDDGKNGLLRGVCFELIKFVHDSTQGFGQAAQFVYDNRKILFTNKRIEQFALEIDTEKVQGIVRDFLRGSPVKIEVRPCQTDKHELDLNGIVSSISHHPDQQSDRSLRTFLEMLTSQPFLNAGTHDIIGAGRLFKRQICKELEDGIVTREGIAKGVRVIDNNGEPKAALVADVKTCAFFASRNLEEIVMEMVQKRRFNINNASQMDRFWSHFNHLFRGVSGYLTYAPSRVIVIDAISQRKMSEISFDVDGRPMSMVDFFRTKKNIPINGQLPAVRQQQDRETLFPMSCVIILPGQRVTIDKMSEFISRELLSANTQPPARRYAAIEMTMKQIGATSSGFLANFGVRLSAESTVKIGVHQMPKIKFGNTVTSFQDRINPAVRFLEPSDILSQWVVAFPGHLEESTVRNFVTQMIRMGQQKGMVLPQPTFVRIEIDELNTRMQELSKRGIQFLLFVDNKSTKSHAPLKLCEKRQTLLTQHVTIEVAENAKAMTLSNVLNKMNMKLFGYNYMPILSPAATAKFNILGGDVLVIGVDSSLPPRATAFERYSMRSRGMAEFLSEDPMIVGICANYAPVNPMKFCGDYFFQPFKSNALEPEFLYKKLGELFAKVKQNRQPLPSVVFIIRDGISEGAIQKNVHDEFPVYAEACHRCDANWRPKFVYCIVDKGHNKRFFIRDQQQQAANTTPGCVIDSKVTSVDTHEFWLQAHTPLKGTARIPQYVFPVNQMNANNEELQGFLLAMCCNWQIVNLAPALPTPVRQAAELAKRGRNNYLELKRNMPHFIPVLSGTSQIDYVSLNQRLCYETLWSFTRFNA
ncbi:hypothetical protein niasHS_007154 [Heterodera schachtii]|uniref:Piwi domain-containing protein n=1 Tax=Heterodera schachtii TaxID=97005 RepID=A0ABD2JL68_HETSC